MLYGNFLTMSEKTVTVVRGDWGVCTKCHREMQGIVERLHKHYVKCWVGEVNCDSDADADTAEDNDASTRSHQPELMNIAPSSRNESVAVDAIK